MSQHITSKQVRILIVEDNHNDIDLLNHELKKSGFAPLLRIAQTKEEYEYELQQFKPEIILCDFSLPSFDGLTAFHIKQKIVPETPFIVVSGMIGEDKAIELVKEGVTDYVLKEKLSQVIPKISRALHEAAEVQERKNIFEKLTQSEVKYRTLFDMSPFPMWVFDVETFYFLDVNQAAIKHYGYSRDEFMSMTIKDIRPQEDVLKVEEIVRHTKKTGAFTRGIFTHIKKNGQHISVEIQSNLIDLDGKKVRIVLASDVSSRVRYIREIETKNKKLEEIAWIQSHLVRAPLARVMGLVNLLELSKDHAPEILEHILTSANELDAIIRDIVKKTSELDNTDNIQ
jgi:PAS domain S-box-containing protein